MIIDIAYLLVAVMAVIKGLRKGFVIVILSLLAFIIGLAAALKLSTVVAAYLDDATGLPAKWMPVLAFILVFTGVVLLVNIGAAIITKTLDLAMLGPVNRIAGATFNLLLQTIIFSVILFYVVQVGWLGENTTRESKVYEWVAPVGPYVIDLFAKVFPMFRDLFDQLKDFFEGVQGDIKTKEAASA